MRFFTCVYLLLFAMKFAYYLLDIISDIYISGCFNYSVMVFLSTANAFVFDSKHENNLNLLNFDGESHGSYMSKN